MYSVRIVIAEAGDAQKLAGLHAEALPDDYLPSLGLDFLEKVYYPAALQSTHAITYKAVVQGKAVGFVTVAHDSSGFTQDVTRGRSGKMAVAAVRAMLRNPMHIFKSLQVFWAAALVSPDPIPGEIVFIAVDEAYRGCGIGKQLVLQSLQYLREHNEPACRTKTLAQNTQVIGLYLKLGWYVREHFHLIGNEYVTLVGMCEPTAESG